MHVGVQMVFQSYGYPAGLTDSQVYGEEVALAELADSVGFDSIWPVEHHFEDYSFCPDNVVFLAHMAARTSRIQLATGAVIMPWNDPLRVAEKIALLDELSGGRVLLGMGRGLARREYAGFGISMDESRERFDQSAAMVIDALATGYMENDEGYYPQPRVPIRPAPSRPFDERTYCIAMSDDSAMSAAELGGRMVCFSQTPWDKQVLRIDAYRDRFRQTHGREPHAPVCCDFTFCDPDAARAEDMVREHMVGYLTSVLGHYELAGEHFKNTAGYESYGNAVDAVRAAGVESIAEMYLDVQAWGTPDQVLQKLEARRQVIGDFDLTCCFRYSGISFDDAKGSMTCFAENVIPVIRQQSASA
jgi:alkanesulfonate monooxygenase SsuD/methylene tetrahydromethanopterin reductase-like flavin-dependent oxidoreductase (luciferase family)